MLTGNLRQKTGVHPCPISFLCCISYIHLAKFFARIVMSIWVTEVTKILIVYFNLLTSECLKKLKWGFLPFLAAGKTFKLNSS